MTKEINLSLSKREVEKKQIEAMRKLGMNDAEIAELMDYDKAVNKDEKNLPFDLTEEQQKRVEAVTRTTAKKKPTIYQLDNKEGKRNKKKNETKVGIIGKIANLLAEIAENVEILNPERQISFTLGENTYEITLTQKRKPKN